MMPLSFIVNLVHHTYPSFRWFCGLDRIGSRRGMCNWRNRDSGRCRSIGRDVSQSTFERIDDAAYWVRSTSRVVHHFSTKKRWVSAHRERCTSIPCCILRRWLPGSTPLRFPAHLSSFISTDNLWPHHSPKKKKNKIKVKFLITT